MNLNSRYQLATLIGKPNASSRSIRSCSPQHDLQGQSVAIIGLGKSGRAAARLALARRAASVLAFDQNPNLGLLEKDSEFHEFGGDNGVLRTVLGEFDGEVLDNVDRVVVSPGVPLRKFGLSDLLQSGKQVMSELDFAAEILPKGIKILAVIGTNGKSTTVTFAGQMLTHLGINAFVGGNLGNPLSEAAFHCLQNPLPEPMFKVAVVEVSSYQMEIPNKYFCPSVSVVLNLTPDHLERHRTMRDYAVAKCRLFQHMSDPKLGLLCVGNQYLNEAVMESLDEINLAWIGATPGVRIGVPGKEGPYLIKIFVQFPIVDMEDKIASFEVPALGINSQLQLGAMNMIGTHNYENAAVAALSVVGLDVGLDVGDIGPCIKKLRPPPHRMEIVCKDIHGVTWVDDSKATNVEATYTGLMGLRGQKSVVLLGGLAKVLDGHMSNGFEQLIEPLKYHRCVITFGTSGLLIQKTLSDSGLSIPSMRAENLKDAVNLARKMAEQGDTILLSPGSASFDEFRDFEHRGMVFQELALSSY